MASKSAAQARYMAGCANNPEKMKKCPPRKVAREYHEKDKAAGIMSKARKQQKRLLH